MRLLVSVADATEAAAALEGGADIIDAKNPRAGALGPVTLDEFRAIHATCAGTRPVTAALGDGSDEDKVENDALAYCGAGAALVKIGFAGISSPVSAAALIAAAVRGAGTANGLCGAVAVAYADANVVNSLAAPTLIDAAARAGAAGLLIDTADKSGPGLLSLVSSQTLTSWVEQARASGLFIALAGKLTIEDISRLCATAADIVGVRGAACEGGRMGRVSPERVRDLWRIVNARFTIHDSRFAIHD